MRVRFAPSPTGALHIGGARTALYNWLLARQSGGAFVLRIEDTDRERSTPENVEQIYDALRWLELEWDEGPFSQAQRRPRHEEEIQRLQAEGHAYLDEGAVRLRVPDEGATTVQDVIRGEVVFEHAAIDDFVIARSDGSPLYNLAVAVDDRDMGITHVVRGADHLSNTPPDPDPARTRGGAARLRPPAAPARPGRQEALEAPRGRVGPGAARCRLPARGRAQLHRAACLVQPQPDDPAAWEKVMTDGAPDRLRRAREALAAAEPFDAESIESALRAVVDELGVKPREVYQPIRVAISGRTVSPGIF